MISMTGTVMLVVGPLKTATTKPEPADERIVDCSTCRACVGKGCVTPKGVLGRPHVARIRAAEALRAKR